jgi:hypothetical protein
MSEFVEVCWFVYGIRVGKTFFGYKVFHSRGKTASVEFSWEKAMNPLLIGWVHTHGPFGFYPSERDNATMRSWVRAKNKPMICGISCDGIIVWYDYFRNKDLSIDSHPMRVTEENGFVFGTRCL